MEFFIAGLIALILVTVFGLICNDQVLKNRLWFIENKYDKFHTLPDYNEMFCSFKYLHMWTVKQWVTWVEKQ